MAPAAPALPPEVCDFVQGGVSITIASRDDRLVPSLAKGVGCRVAPTHDGVEVLLFANTAEALLRDIAAHRQAAVVFSQPSSNRTLQLKGRDLAVRPAQPTDVALVRRWMLLFTDDLRKLGWDRAFVEGVFWHDPVHLVVLRFTPEGAFQQTPGPQAGQAMPMAPGAAR